MQKLLVRSALALALGSMFAGCAEETVQAEAAAGISPQLFTDSLFAVMNADRANYTTTDCGATGTTRSRGNCTQ